MSATVIALATVLVIVIILSTVAISLLHVRDRRKASTDRGPSTSVLSPLTPGFGMRFVPPSHPASHITPFGSTPQRPIFNHEPGSNMRIAHRREDGGWDFSQSGFNSATLLRPPESVYSADGAPPISPTASSIWTQSYPVPSKAREANSSASALTAPPPPAYSREDSPSSIHSHSLA